jgi:hypothetical protein
LPAEHEQHEDEDGLVHRRFADYRTSGLTVTVRPQLANPIKLVVGKPVPPAERENTKMQ